MNHKMCLYVYYSVTLILTVAFILLVFFKIKNKKKMFLWSAAIIFLSCSFWMGPTYFYERVALSCWARFSHAAAYSLGNSILIFGLSGEMKQVSALKDFLLQNGMAGGFAEVVSFVAAAFYPLAPVVTISAIASLFSDILSLICYKVRRLLKKEIYIFSELNERSITLAEDIVSNKKAKRKSLIVFCDVFSHNNESSYELQDRAAGIGAICLKKDIVTIKWIRNIGKRRKETVKKESRKKVFIFSLIGIVTEKWIVNVGKRQKETVKKKSRKKIFKFFLIGNDENENLEQTIKLIDRYDQKVKEDTVTIYLFSKSSTSELSIDSKINNGQQDPDEDSKSTVNVIRVDYTRSMIYNYLYEQGSEIINSATGDKKKRFEILILGMGEHGLEMLKALLWFCRRSDYELKIDVYDNRKDIAEHFYALCPGIKKVNQKEVYPNERIICFHPKTDFNQKKFFSECLPKHSGANFVFVSIGDDSENIALARKIREAFARQRIEKKNFLVAMSRPIITTVVEKAQVKSSLEENRYDITIIGDLKSVYSERVIINSDLERIANVVHKHNIGNLADSKNITTYDRSAFYKEYNYRSTIAQVIYHLAWKRSNGESDKWKEFEELLNKLDFPDKLSVIYNDRITEYLECYSDEKERWNYYEWTEGFEKYDGKNTDRDAIKMLKNDLHRHDLIRPFHELSDKDQKGEAKYFCEAYWILLRQNDS